MTPLNFTLRAARFLSSAVVDDDRDDPDDDETNTEGLDDGGGLEEADGDLDFEENGDDQGEDE